MASIEEMKKIIDEFGGIEKINDSKMKCDYYDVYCWETKEWFSSRYWAKYLKDKSDGITLHELLCIQNDYEKLLKQQEFFNKES